MNLHALYHLNDSNYCYPIDTNKIVVVFRTQKNDEDIESIECIYNISHHFYLKRLVKKMEVVRSDNLFDYYETVIELEIPNMQYLFKINMKNGKYLYFYDCGMSEDYDFNTGYLTGFRLPFVNKNDVVFQNERFKGDVVYQIFPDRFKKCETGEIDKSYVNRTWDTNDLKWNKDDKRQAFLGGDLIGIKEKLPYLKDLGIDAIYLTPVTESSSNHKYNISNYFKIDEMFGGNKAYKELVEEAHKLGIKIIMDLVYNHSDNRHPFFLDVLKNGKKSPYYDYYCMVDKQLKANGMMYHSFCDVKDMPKWNTNNPKVQEYLTSVALYFKQEYGVDGFRLDVANEVSHDFWIYFKNALKKVDKDIFIIGENWDYAHEFLNNNQFESVMNYQFYLAMWEYFIWKKYGLEEFSNRINWLLNRYKLNNAKMMLNLLDSHDTPRFYNYLDGNIDKYLCAETILISYIGLPMIYYGNEIFMKGEGDPYNRRGMEWDSKYFDSKEHQMFKDIVHLRKKLNALRTGKIKVEVVNEALKITRWTDEETVEIYVNAENKNISLNEIKGEVILSNNYDINNKTLKPYSFVVLRK